MPKKKKSFADDGWAVWVEGDDTSTVYINDWLNPKGKSFVDLAVRIRGINVSQGLYVFVPFAVEKSEIEDPSLRFDDRRVLQATFSAACIIDYKKNRHTSEIAYNGKTVDIVHISTLDFKLCKLGQGTLISLDFEQLIPSLDNDEAYFIWRIPHKSLDELFKSQVNVDNVLQRLRYLITTPVVSEKYGYAIRVNEAGVLPEEINRLGAFHRQKLKKAVVSISIDENYELNDSGCYRIRRLEEHLYKNYLPEGYEGENVITYQWNQTREHNLQGHFSFYYNIFYNHISQSSMVLYMIILLTVGVLGDLFSAIIKKLINLI